jgi:pilus assembly protein CpaE
MLRCIVICPDQKLAARLESAINATGEVSIGRSLYAYPNATDLVRTLRAQAPEIVFLSFESVDRALELVKFLESESEGVQIIAVHSSMDPKVLRESMRSGVREFVAEPFDRQSVFDALKTVNELIQRKPPTIEASNQIFAFLPSKAGVGTSTIALNVSAAMARRPGMNVLLSDFDLNSGMLRFMLKLTNEYSVIDAAEHAMRIDENLWPSLVTSINTMDVLHAGRINPNLRIDTTQIRALVDFARRNYSALSFDLSGNLERYSLELMQEAKRVLLVCTPEIPSLHLAREKLYFLRSLDLDTRVSVILNRCQKKGLFSKEQVEEILGVPVVKTFANDYHGVNRAVTNGTCIDPSTEMGKSFTQFAEDLLGPKTGAKTEQKKKFLEYFAVQPGTLERTNS